MTTDNHRFNAESCRVGAWFWRLTVDESHRVEIHKLPRPRFLLTLRPSIKTISRRFRIPRISTRHTNPLGRKLARNVRNSSRRFPRISDTMLTASNPIIAQASAWIAVVMLFVQSLPATCCGCSDSNSTDCHEVAQLVASCCSSVKPDSRCEKKAKSACCCGRECSCTASSAPAQAPAGSTPPEDDRQERLECLKSSQQGICSKVALCSNMLLRHPGAPLITTTALDRCIELSRFTC